MSSWETIKLVRSTLFSVLARGSDVIFLFLLVLAARFLGDEQYGQFSFGFALVFIFEFAVDFGLKDLLVREISRKKDAGRWWVQKAIRTKITLAILTILCIGGLTVLLPLGSEMPMVIGLLTFAMVMKSFKVLFRSVIMAHERFDLDAYVVLVDRAILFLLAGGVLIAGYGLIPFAGAFALAHTINLGIAASVVMRDIHQLSKPEKTEWISIELLKQAIPFGLNIAVVMLYFRLDSIMLGLIRGDVEVGWYNAAYKISEGLLVIPTVLYNVLFPRLSILHQGDQTSVERIVGKGCKYLIAIGVFITVLGIVGAEKWIEILYGTDYARASWSLRILLLTTTFMFLWLVFVALLNSINRPRIPVLGVTICTILNVVLNFALIPQYGYIGASISTVLADVCLVSFLYLFLVRSGYRLNVLSHMVKPLMAGVCIGLLSYYLLLPMNVFFWAVICTLSYGATLLIFGFLDRKEMAIFQEFVLSLKFGGKRLYHPKG